MASFSQHKADCLRFLGFEYGEVHTWLDECFATMGPLHRKARHHRGGLREIKDIFGPAAVKAGIIHILRDCRHIPDESDYKTGAVDSLGLKKNWSTAAYIKYSDENFEDLVEQQFKPTGLILWVFLAWNDLKSFLTSIAHYSPEEVDGMRESWVEARKRLDSSEVSVDTSLGFTPLSERTNVDAEVKKYLEETVNLWSNEELAQMGHTLIAGFVPISILTNPLVYIDYELLEEIKPELAGTSPIDVVQFALPRKVQSNVRAVAEAGNKRSITFVSNQKTMRVSDVRLRSTPEGTEVSYLISASSSGVIVGDLGDRLLIRNGIHRAFLLAQLGITEIPCLLVTEQNPIPVVSTVYPTFSPAVLIQPRQPLLVDFLKPEFCLQAPIQKTHRIIRISAEETLIPVD